MVLLGYPQRAPSPSLRAAWWQQPGTGNRAEAPPVLGTALVLACPGEIRKCKRGLSYRPWFLTFLWVPVMGTPSGISHVHPMLGEFKV